MAYRKRLGLVLALLLLWGLTISVYKLSVHKTSPGIPEGWKRHRDLFGRLEIWLPEEWTASGPIYTLLHRLRQVAEGSPSPPVLFTAWEDRSSTYSQWIKIISYDGIMAFLAPFGGEEMVRECSKINPVELTLHTTETVYLDGSGIIAIEVSGGWVAYQSKAIVQHQEYDLVRTVACIVSPDHVYLVYMDTVEPPEGLKTSEIILKNLQVFK